MDYVLQARVFSHAGTRNLPGRGREPPADLRPTVGTVSSPSLASDWSTAAGETDGTGIGGEGEEVKPLPGTGRSLPVGVGRGVG